MTRRVNLEWHDLPNEKVNAWLEANHIDPSKVLAAQEVEVNDVNETIAYIGWVWPRRLTPDGDGFVKRAYSVRLWEDPEKFGLVAVEETQ